MNIVGLAHKACLENFRVRYHRLHRLLETLQLAREERPPSSSVETVGPHPPMYSSSTIGDYTASAAHNNAI